jgi:hypothetical protein
VHVCARVCVCVHVCACVCTCVHVYACVCRPRLELLAAEGLLEPQRQRPARPLSDGPVHHLLGRCQQGPVSEAPACPRPGCLRHEHVRHEHVRHEHVRHEHVRHEHVRHEHVLERSLGKPPCTCTRDTRTCSGGDAPEELQ